MNMNFKTARKLVMVLMIVSVVSAVGGVVFIRPGTQASVYVMLTSLISMVLAIGVMFTLCRCPWCDKRIFNGMMKVEVCPHCKRDLETGKKRKGKRK